MNWHPMACKKICDYGECKDSTCKLLHQNICKTYSKQGQCPRKITGSYTPTIPPKLDKKKQWMDYRMKIIRADMTDIMETINSLVARTITNMEMAQPVHTVSRAISGQICTIIIIKT